MTAMTRAATAMVRVFTKDSDLSCSPSGKRCHRVPRSRPSQTAYADAPRVREHGVG